VVTAATAVTVLLSRMANVLRRMTRRARTNAVFLRERPATRDQLIAGQARVVVDQIAVIGVHAVNVASPRRRSESRIIIGEA
jgi:hypothetical protein